jgi:hypothetical protein
MATTINQTVIIIMQDSLGNVTATYSIAQGTTDFPGQTVNHLNGTLTIPGGATALPSALTLIAEAQTAAGV